MKVREADPWNTLMNTSMGRNGIVSTSSLGSQNPYMPGVEFDGTVRELRGFHKVETLAIKLTLPQ